MAFNRNITTSMPFMLQLSQPRCETGRVWLKGWFAGSWA
jgi:hypothetical protein